MTRLSEIAATVVLAAGVLAAGPALVGPAQGVTAPDAGPCLPSLVVSGPVSAAVFAGQSAPIFTFVVSGGDPENTYGWKDLPQLPGGKGVPKYDKGDGFLLITAGVWPAQEKPYKFTFEATQKGLANAKTYFYVKVVKPGEGIAVAGPTDALIYAGVKGTGLNWNAEAKDVPAQNKYAWKPGEDPPKVKGLSFGSPKTSVSDSDWEVKGAWPSPDAADGTGLWKTTLDVSVKNTAGKEFTGKTTVSVIVKDSPGGSVARRIGAGPVPAARIPAAAPASSDIAPARDGEIPADCAVVIQATGG
jgi:hypothetical protein